MPTNRRNIGIALIILGLILIALIIYFSLLRKPVAGPPPVGSSGTSTAQLPAGPSVGTTTPGDIPRNHQQYALGKDAVHQTNADDLGKIAMVFSERLGSFSNQSGYNNVSDLEALMTVSLRTWADTYVGQLTQQYKNNGVFYGITTHALTFSVSSFDDQAGQAKIIVTTQRSEVSGPSGAPKVYRQKIDLSFLKVNGGWLVDSAYWEK